LENSRWATHKNKS